jgi:hypothetical protein
MKWVQNIVLFMTDGNAYHNSNFWWKTRSWMVYIGVIMEQPCNTQQVYL